MPKLPTLLDDLDLNQYESAAYLALLKKKRLTANELSAISGIPQGRVYNVAQGLMDKGFCTLFAGSPRRFEVVDPALVVENLVLAQERDLASRLNRMQALKKELSVAFLDSEDTTSPLDYMQVITSKVYMLSRYLKLTSGAQKIIRTFNKQPYASDIDFKDFEKFKIQKQEVTEARSTGVHEQAIYEFVPEHLEYFILWMKHNRETGEEVRVAERLPIKLLLVDDSTAMFTLSKKGMAEGQFTSVVVDHPDLTLALGELFDWHWSQAMELDIFLETYER